MSEICVGDKALEALELLENRRSTALCLNRRFEKHSGFLKIHRKIRLVLAWSERITELIWD